MHSSGYNDDDFRNGCLGAPLDVYLAVWRKSLPGKYSRAQPGDMMRSRRATAHNFGCKLRQLSHRVALGVRVFSVVGVLTEEVQKDLRSLNDDMNGNTL